MARKIVLFSDGTGNSSAKAEKTNVWRMFEALDQSGFEQIAKYDDGVGASRNKYLAAIGGAFGWGLKRNVIDLYKVVCRTWVAGDEISGFGFSRGAFTIRVLVGLIVCEGLVPFTTEEELDRHAKAAYRHYRSENFKSISPIVWFIRHLRDAALKVYNWIRDRRDYPLVADETRAKGRTDIPIKFLGLWDTVAAYGMPVEELKVAIDKVFWPMMFGETNLAVNVERACHALSLDDERRTFHPIPWDETSEAKLVTEGKVKAGRITQVWFAGVHSNLGGGYPEDRLSLVSLHWMMGEAIKAGLKLNPVKVDEVAHSKSAYARLYDSRAGFAAYYRYAPRHIPFHPDTPDTLPIIHGSVIFRMAKGLDNYVPIILPPKFWVLGPDGELLPVAGPAQQISFGHTRLQKTAPPLPGLSGATIGARTNPLKDAVAGLGRPDTEILQQVADTVWWRRVNFFMTVFWTLLLVLLPFSERFWEGVLALLRRVPGLRALAGWSVDVSQESEWFARDLIQGLSGIIPSYLTSWTQALENHPVAFFFFAALVLMHLQIGKLLQTRIHDRAMHAWHSALKAGYAQSIAHKEIGARNMTFAVLALAIGFCVASGWNRGDLRMPPIELRAVVALLAILSIWRWSSAREFQKKGAMTRHSPGLRFARMMRTSKLVKGMQTLLSVWIVPGAFVIALLAAGGCLVNRVVYDVSSAAGFDCTPTVTGKDPTEKPGTKPGFTTDQTCWASGLVLEEGKRYRITLRTPGDWFDRGIRTDVVGFEAKGFRQWLATPLKRWWSANWFAPIARIGSRGKDEYLVAPATPLKAERYESDVSLPDNEICTKPTGEQAQKAMKDKPISNDRQVVVADITARSTGELFVYVNDAVVAWPGQRGMFYCNNLGSGEVTVEEIASRRGSELLKSDPSIP